MEKNSYVYIVSNKKHGTLYIGVTSNLTARILQHKQKVVNGFSKKYNLNKLVYFECYESIYPAITREKQLKKWNRDWKIALVEAMNPNWKDLWDDII